MACVSHKLTQCLSRFLYIFPSLEALLGPVSCIHGVLQVVTISPCPRYKFVSPGLDLTS